MRFKKISIASALVLGALFSTVSFADDLSIAQNFIQMQYVPLIQSKFPASLAGSKFSTLFANAYANPILNVQTYQPGTPPQSYPQTYVLTGGSGCYGPPAAGAQYAPISQYPDWMSPMWIRDAAAQFHAYLTVYQSNGAYTRRLTNQN